jgi:hypothetical protein
MNCAVGVTSCGRICLSNFMQIGMDVQVKIRFFSQKFERQ